MGLREALKAVQRAAEPPPRREPTADRLVQVERLLDKAYGHGKGKR
jgi:hypothetical protein